MDAHAQLGDANDTLQTVKQDSERSVAYHEARAREAAVRAERNEKLREKLQDFIV